MSFLKKVGKVLKLWFKKEARDAKEELKEKVEEAKEQSKDLIRDKIADIAVEIVSGNSPKEIKENIKEELEETKDELREIGQSVINETFLNLLVSAKARNATKDEAVLSLIELARNLKKDGSQYYSSIYNEIKDGLLDNTCSEVKSLDLVRFIFLSFRNNPELSSRERAKLVKNEIETSISEITLAQKMTYYKYYINLIIYVQDNYNK